MLNNNEVQKIISSIKNLWPGRFNNEQIDIILEGLNSFSFEDSIEAIKDCAIDVGFVGVGEIVSRAKLISGEKARVAAVTKERPRGCGDCIDGRVFALDPRGYEFAFTCRCVSSPGAIPVWDEEYTKRGFKKREPRKIVGGVSKTTLEVKCQQCGHHVGDSQRIKITYRD